MAEVASLVMAVDTGQVKTAAKDLDGLTAAAAKTETATTSLEKATARVSTSAKSMSDAVSSSVARFESFNTTTAKAAASFGQFNAGIKGVGAGLRDIPN